MAFSSWMQASSLLGSTAGLNNLWARIMKSTHDRVGEIEPEAITAVTADDCRRNARECLVSAEEASEVEDWCAFMKLACDWLLSASRLDGDRITDRLELTSIARERITMISKC